MKRTVLIVAAIVAAGIAASPAAQAQDERMQKRLYPKSANADGTLNCAPSCDLLGPCC